MAGTSDAAAPAVVPREGARVVLPGQSPDGRYVLSVLLKRTFDIVPGADCVRAAEDVPLNAGEVFWDHPMNSSVRYESDFIPFKLATDVVLNGHAHAPDGSPVAAMNVSLQVADVRKTLSVIGDRTASWTGGGQPAISDPEPFTTMPLTYERAYGGTDVYSDLKVPYPYPRNLLGRGFVVKNVAKAVDGLLLPNVEDPAARLAASALCLGDYLQWESKPLPAGFGWVPKHWYPRALLAGVMPCDRPVEQELRKAYSELLSGAEREAYEKNGFRDMDFRFFSGASPGLVLPFLDPGALVIAENLTPDGYQEFRLPPDAPRIGLDIGEGVSEPEVVLHTVMIRMDDRQVDLVWRGAVPYQGPDWLPQMRKMDVQVEG